MTAYLGFYAEFGSQVLRPEDHEHEVGEDTIRCTNCQLDELAAGMSPFEISCFNWYFQNVTRFARDAGLVADLIRQEGMEPKAFKLFVQAMDLIYGTMERIAADRVRGETEKT